MLQDFAVRKMFPQTCMPFAPFEKSPCRPAKHFRRPKKVSAGVYAFQNIRGKFPQPSTPFPRPGSFLFSGSPLSSRADSAAAVRQSHRVNLPRVADVPERIGICAPEKRPCTPVDAILTPGI